MWLDEQSSALQVSKKWTMPGSTMDTVVWQRVEGALVFLASCVLFLLFDDGILWWLAILLFFAPDVSFAAYTLGPRIGSVAYNLVHVFAFGVILLPVGVERWLGESEQVR